MCVVCYVLVLVLSLMCLYFVSDFLIGLGFSFQSSSSNLIINVRSALGLSVYDSCVRCFLVSPRDLRFDLKSVQVFRAYRFFSKVRFESVGFCSSCVV